jgi:hypothetical protein
MPVFKLTPIPGLRPSTRRGVAFLEDEHDDALDAASTFSSLKTKADRTVRDRLDHWIEGGHKPNWFHGWPDRAAYKECWVFKWDERKVHQRLYGFLSNPSRTNKALQVCVLVFHDTKTDQTDFSILDRINVLRQSAAVLHALRKMYP